MKESLQNKRVLVVGATGLIGSNLVRRLLETGAYVLASGRSIEKLQYVFEKECTDDKLRLVAFDISKEEIPMDIGNINYIFHAASPISAKDIIEKPVDTIKANINGVLASLNYLKVQKEKCKVVGRCIIFSSATVYGNHFETDTIVEEPETYIADALHMPNTPYSESKRMVEVIAQSYYQQFGVESVIARIGYVYGYAKNKPKTAFYDFVETAINGKNIILNNSGMSARDNIHVDDVVNGLITLALNGMVGEAYNISSNGELLNFIAIDDIALLIAEIIKEFRPECQVKAIIKPYDGRRKPGVRLGNEKIKQLGWNVNVGIKEGIRDTICKYLEELHNERQP